MFHETDTQFTESLFVLHCKLNSFQGLLLSTANLKLVVQNHVTELKAKHKNYKFCILNKLTGTTGYWQVPPVTVLASHLSPPQANSSIWYDTLACHIQLQYMYPFLVSCIYKVRVLRCCWNTLQTAKFFTFNIFHDTVAVTILVHLTINERPNHLIKWTLTKMRKGIGISKWLKFLDTILQVKWLDFKFYLNKRVSLHP